MAAAYFSNPSSPDSDDAAVESILSQAADLCALEQIAALNTSHLSYNNTTLPADLDARFRRLASFPAGPNHQHPKPTLLADNQHIIPTIITEETKTLSSASPNPHQAIKPEASPTVKIKDSEGPTSRSGYEVSRPWKVGRCFGCYPKRARKKKNKEKKGEAGQIYDDDEFWETNDHILSDLKDQQRKLKKMLMEQEKVEQEVGKVFGLVKQASAKLATADTAADQLSSEDDEDFK